MGIYIFAEGEEGRAGTIAGKDLQNLVGIRARSVVEGDVDLRVGIALRRRLLTADMERDRNIRIAPQTIGDRIGVVARGKAGVGDGLHIACGDTCVDLFNGIGNARCGQDRFRVLKCVKDPVGQTDIAVGGTRAAKTARIGNDGAVLVGQRIGRSLTMGKTGQHRGVGDGRCEKNRGLRRGIVTGLVQKYKILEDIHTDAVDDEKCA